MHRLLPIFALATIALVASGCHKQDPLIGSWTGNSSLSGTSQTMTLNISPDGTYSEDILNSRPNFPVRLVVHDKGTWKPAGPGKYDFRITDTDWVTEGATSEKTAKARARFESRKAKIIAESNKEPTVSIAWSGNDKFTLTESTMTETFTRTK